MIYHGSINCRWGALLKCWEIHISWGETCCIPRKRKIMAMNHIRKIRWLIGVSLSQQRQYNRNNALLQTIDEWWSPFCDYHGIGVLTFGRRDKATILEKSVCESRSLGSIDLHTVHDQCAILFDRTSYVIQYANGFLFIPAKVKEGRGGPIWREKEPITWICLE